jgi:hypothetical protein
MRGFHAERVKILRVRLFYLIGNSVFMEDLQKKPVGTGGARKFSGYMLTVGAIQLESANHHSNEKIKN